MTIRETLDEWRAGGQLSDEQHATLSALVSGRRQSVFLELNALLYLGVLAFVAGLAWTARTYSAAWGDAAILGPSTVLMLAAFGYCASRVGPYTPAQAPDAGFVLDYALYFGCLVFAVELGYLEYRFQLLQAQWHHYLLASAVLYLLLAYRFDNRFVLALAVTTLGSWWGVRVSLWAVFNADTVRLSTLGFGLALAAVGTATYYAGIKRHFLDAYLHVAANAVLGALTSGVVVGRVAVWMLPLLLAAAVCATGGVRTRRFSFVAYGVIYSYIGVSRLMLEGLHGPTDALLYFVVSGAAVLVGLVALARRFGRDV